MSGLEEAQAEYKSWEENYEPKDFIEYTHEAYEKFKEHDPKYVWTNHGTCENEQLTNGCQEYNSVCGCWDNHGWWVCKNPWEGEPMTMYVSTEYRGECPVCNSGANDENIKPDCEECEGSGYIQVYLD